MILLTIILTMASLAGLGYWVFLDVKTKTDEYGETKHSSGPRISRILAALALFILGQGLLASMGVVPAGHRGVVFSKWSGVTDQQVNEGFYVVTPFVESVIPMNVRVVKTTIKASAASKDTQLIDALVVITYNPNPKKVYKIYQNLGDRYTFETNIIKPKSQSAIKSGTAKFKAEIMIANRDKLEALILKNLRAKLDRFDLVVSGVEVKNISFDKDYTDAIEDKVKQEQIAKKEILIVDQREAQADQKVAEARGTKEAKILQAEGIAEANALLDRSLTPQVLQQRWLNVWDGVLPKYIAGDASNIINIPSQ